MVHAHLSRLGRLRKICSDHNHPFLSPNTSAGKARRDKLLLAEINPLLVRRGRLYPGEANERHRRLLRTQRAAYTSSRARIPPLVKRAAVSPAMSGSNRLMHSIINPAPAYPVIPTGQRYYRRGPGPSFSRNILISSSLIGVGLIVLAIHMLRTASETPISAAIRGMLWS